MRIGLTILLARICGGLYARCSVLSGARAYHFAWLAKPLLVSMKRTSEAMKHVESSTDKDQVRRWTACSHQ
jgi:hypothetical protein